MIAWPLISDPSGSDRGKWLECNGQIVDPSIFPKLAELMSHTPNYMGIFLRGYGSQTSNHYGSILHQSAALNDLQGDAIRNIKGQFGNEFGDNPWFVGGSFYTGDRFGYGGSEQGGSLERFIYFDSSRVVPTANENRPINKAVRYLIRAA